jgi:hypothetical protein
VAISTSQVGDVDAEVARAHEGQRVAFAARRHGAEAGDAERGGVACLALEQIRGQEMHVARPFSMTLIATVVGA